MRFLFGTFALMSGLGFTACDDDMPASRPSLEVGAPTDAQAGGAGGADGEWENSAGKAGMVSGAGGGGTTGAGGSGAGGSGDGGSGDGGSGDGGSGDGGSGDGGGGEPPVDSTEIVVIDLDQRPYTECESYRIGDEYARDAEGIPLKLYRGTYHDHPVLTAQAGLVWLACYRETNDAWYYEHAIAAGHRLIEMSHDYDGAMFFPYEFDFNLHGSSTNVLRAPWYSGMAQGQVLSLFSRLGELTSEPEWEVVAADTLKSFDTVRGKDDPWIIDIDEENSLWIEEYPLESELHVLNGFIFGMFGLYDYFAWRGDERSQELFLQSLHTLRVNVERFRDPGAASAYCLEHRVKSSGYHAIHIDQLNAITRMTDDPYFASVSDLFAADYPP